MTSASCGRSDARRNRRARDDVRPTGPQRLAHIARIPPGFEILRVTAVPLEFVHHPGDIILPAISGARAFHLHQAMRPQHVLIGLAVDLAVRRDEPAGLVPDRLRHRL